MTGMEDLVSSGANVAPTCAQPGGGKFNFTATWIFPASFSNRELDETIEATLISVRGNIWRIRISAESKEYPPKPDLLLG